MKIRLIPNVTYCVSRIKILSVFATLSIQNSGICRSGGETKKKGEMYERDNRRQLPPMWQLVHAARITYGR